MEPRVPHGREAQSPAGRGTHARAAQGTGAQTDERAREGELAERQSRAIGPGSRSLRSDRQACREARHRVGDPRLSPRRPTLPRAPADRAFSLGLARAVSLRGRAWLGRLLRVRPACRRVRVPPLPKPRHLLARRFPAQRDERETRRRALAGWIHPAMADDRVAEQTLLPEPRCEATRHGD